MTIAILVAAVPTLTSAIDRKPLGEIDGTHRLPRNGDYLEMLQVAPKPRIDTDITGSGLETFCVGKIVGSTGRRGVFVITCERSATPATAPSIDGSNALHERSPSLPFDECRGDEHQARAACA